MNRENADLPINDAVPAPTQIQPGNLFLWNWTAMQEYARTCIAKFGEWHQIETAPKDGTEVILECEYGRRLGCFTHGKWWVGCDEYGNDVEAREATHWRHCPPGPSNA